MAVSRMLDTSPLVTMSVSVDASMQARTVGFEGAGRVDDDEVIRLREQVDDVRELSAADSQPSRIDGRRQDVDAAPMGGDELVDRASVQAIEARKTSLRLSYGTMSSIVATSPNSVSASRMTTDRPVSRRARVPGSR